MTVQGEQVEQISDRLFDLVVTWDPFLSSAVGVPEASSRVPDYSDEAQASLREGFVSIAAELAKVDGDSLDFQEHLTWRMASWQANLWQSIIDSRREEYTVSRYKAWSLPTAVTSVMPKTTIASADDAEALIDRCDKLPKSFAQTTDSLRRGLGNGRVPVSRLVEDAVKLIDGLLSQGGPESTLTKVQVTQDAKVPEGWLDRLELSLREGLRPAMEEFRRVLSEEVQPHSRSDERAGLCWIPGGDEAYQASISEHTTTSLTADEIHELGLATVAELAEEGRDMAERVFGISDLAEVTDKLRNDPELRFGSSEEILLAAQAAYERGAQVLPSFVGRIPETPCEVRAMPAHEAAHMMQAYNRPGDLATGRPGIYWVNTDLKRGPTRYELETLTAHESIPGHHVQWSMAREVKHPRYRNLTPTTAFIEGWALYCERQAGGLGLFTDELSYLGMWSSQSWRASRLVVDSGIHAKGWSRERAVKYMVDNTATSLENAEGEVDRYIGNPGQALAYMTGLLELQRARASAEQRMGTSFDVRSFHDHLLANGSPPLPLVPLIVDHWEETHRETQ